jgi:hypothetical protein
MTSPYINAPLNPPARPRMFNSVIAKVIWTLVPIVSLGLAAAVPLVVAAVKGVVKPWLAIAYVVVEVVVFSVALAISPDGTGDSAVPGFLMVLLIIAAATHTALLDSDKVTIGK